MRHRRLKRRLLAIFILVSLFASADGVALSRGFMDVTGQAKIVIDGVDNDPENKLWDCETRRVPYGDRSEDRLRCMSFRYQVPPEGITSATLHIATEPLGSLQETDATVIAVGQPFANCEWGQGKMPGCVMLHGGFKGSEPSLDLDLFNITCDPSVKDNLFASNPNDLPAAQQAVIAQLQTGVVHVLLQDDTAVYRSQLVLNGGALSVPCGTSAREGTPGIAPGGAVASVTPRTWEAISVAVAAAVAVGSGIVAALVGGLAVGTPGRPPATNALKDPAWGSQEPAGQEQLTPTPLPAPQPTPVSSIHENNPAGAVPLEASPLPTVPMTADMQSVEPALIGGAVAVGIAASGVESNTESAKSNESNENKEGEDEREEACPQAEAQLFGLPDINGRKDCPGTRPSMDHWHSGIDFSSNDETGNPMPLDFEACVTGEVTYVGGPFNMIEVTVENGNRIHYLHASEVYVQPGQHVEAATKLGKTGGTGPDGPNQYELHLHIGAIDKDGNLIDPDCAVAGKENRRLRLQSSEKSPYGPGKHTQDEEDGGAGG